MIVQMKWIAVASLLFALSAGCSSNAPQTAAGAVEENQLREVDSILRGYSGGHQRGPGKLADLAVYEQSQPVGYLAIKSGDVVVIWGARLPGEGAIASGGATEVVAYEKKTPQEGGLVLLLNGTVKSLSADEFKSAAKAKP